MPSTVNLIPIPKLVGNDALSVVVSLGFIIYFHVRLVNISISIDKANVEVDEKTESDDN